MGQKEGCVFCAIVAGVAPAVRIAEDERTLAFLDIFPVSTGHTLIVTKQHYDDLFEADPADVAAVAHNSVGLALALRRAFAPAGLGVFQLNGAAAGQTQFHYHMHLIPRNEGEAFDLHGRKRVADADLAEVAAQVRAALGAH